MSTQPELGMTIHFNDGTTMSLSFPSQVERHNFTSRFEDFFKHRHLTIEADGKLLHIPLTSVKFVEAAPAPKILPAHAIRGASVVT